MAFVAGTKNLNVNVGLQPISWLYVLTRPVQSRFWVPCPDQVLYTRPGKPDRLQAKIRS